MNESAWWRDERPGSRPRFSWLRRRKPVAEAVLSLPLVAHSAPVAGSCDAAPHRAAPVRQLPVASGKAPDQTTVLNLEALPEGYLIPPSQSASPRDSIAGAIAAANAMWRAQEGPTLLDRLRALLAVPLELLLPGPGTALSWPGALLPFQVDGVRALMERDRILLADDMGLGKTLQAVAAIRILFVRRAIESALIVVPATLLDQWRREFDKWAPELRAIIIRGSPTDRAWQWTGQVHVTLVSYDTLLSDFRDNANSPPRRKIWDLVVLDEAQRIKNRNDTSMMVKRLQRKRSWALTGTPLENQVDDLASILEFVDQGELISTRHFHPGAELLERHRRLQLRRKKSDVLDQLPPKRVTRIALTLRPGQRESYDRAEREGVVHLRQLGGAIRIQHVLELITRLKQICNVDPQTGESAKLDDIRERLAILSLQGNRAIVFSQYTDDTFGVGAVARALGEFKPLAYTGDLSSRERHRVIQLFKTDDTRKALVLSLRAGGLGLNLQEASYVFHLDRWWNPAIERQAEDRSHRYGQLAPVNVFKYTCAGTIEERIDAMLEQKQRLFNELIDDVSLDVRSQLSAEELFGLFGLETPAPARQEPAPGPAGFALEERCARILSARGWTARRTSVNQDGDIDLIIGSRLDEVGIEETVYLLCRDHPLPVDISVIRDLVGALPDRENARLALAAPLGVTVDAARFAAQCGVVIWDEARLLDLETATYSSLTGDTESETPMSSEDKLWENIMRRQES